MSASPVISVHNLSKRYVIGHAVPYVTLRDALGQGARRLWSRVRGAPEPDASREEFWALRDVSFTVNRGEVVGIIGRNGAGKSTLLKVLSRITEPTAGRVGLRGRVASLLEVGTGFHPELTGRENIFLNGAILGMRRGEIARKFDEIVAFAEVERFLDTPVKHYSSGMYVRLAFAVAAHLEPEILIIDEVLAVGDTAFQKKCLGKMQAVASQEGRTVLFVSHSLTAVQYLCGSCLWLKDGQVARRGEPARVISEYLSDGTGSHGSGGLVRHSHDRFGISRLEVNGSAQPALIAGQPCRIVLEYDCPAPELFSAGIGVSLTLRTVDQKIVNLWSAYAPHGPLQPLRRGRIECELPNWPFRDNSFLLDLYVHHGAETLVWIEGALTISSHDGDYYRVGRLTNRGEGLVFLPQTWHHASR